MLSVGNYDEDGKSAILHSKMPRLLILKMYLLSQRQFIFVWDWRAGSKHRFRKPSTVFSNHGWCFHESM